MCYPMLVDNFHLALLFLEVSESIDTPRVSHQVFFPYEASQEKVDTMSWLFRVSFLRSFPESYYASNGMSSGFISGSVSLGTNFSSPFTRTFFQLGSVRNATARILPCTFISTTHTFTAFFTHSSVSPP